MLRYFSSAGYIAIAEHCEHADVSVGLVALILKFEFSTHINNFELTDDPFKLVKLYMLSSVTKIDSIN